MLAVHRASSTTENSTNVAQGSDRTSDAFRQVRSRPEQPQGRLCGLSCRSLSKVFAQKRSVELQKYKTKVTCSERSK